jgi:hypothetical protein
MPYRIATTKVATELDMHSQVISTSSVRIPNQSVMSSVSPVAMIHSSFVTIPMPSYTVMSPRYNSPTPSMGNVDSSFSNKSTLTVSTSHGLIAGDLKTNQSHAEGVVSRLAGSMSPMLVTNYSSIKPSTILTHLWTSLTSHFSSMPNHSGSTTYLHTTVTQRSSALDPSKQFAGYSIVHNKNSTGIMHSLPVSSLVPTVTPTVASTSPVVTEDIHEELMKLNNMTITVDLALNVTEKLERLTLNSSLLFASDVKRAVEVLEKVTSTHPKEREVGRNILDCVSNLMDVEDEVLSESQTSWNSTVRAVIVIDQYASTVEVTSSKPFEIRSKSVHLIIVMPGGNMTSDGIKFPESFNSSGNDVFTTSSVELSGHTLASQNDHDGDRRWWFVSYKNSKLFRSAGKGAEVIGEVVALSVDRGPLKNLEHPVVLKFKIQEANGSCAFWKFTDGETSGQWADEGCWKSDNTTYPYTTCECDHLTHFAVTFQPVEPTGSISTSEELSDQTKNIVIAGCGIAILVLTLILLTFWCMRKKRFGVYGNLCLCVTICNVLFVVSLFPSGTVEVCQGIGVALHLFMMLSFAWLVGKSFILFRTVVFNVDNDGWFHRHGLKFMVLLCWGIPIVYVGVLGYFNFSHYGSDSLCWLNDDYIWWIAGPIMGATGLSLLLWFVALCWYCCRSGQLPQTAENRNKQLPSRLLGMFLIGCGLGTTWLLATFWLLQYREELFLSYILIGDNISTSFLMFIFYCLTDSQVCYVLDMYYIL